MRRFLFAVVVALFASSVFAQVQAPDYTDTSTWKYEECDDDFLQPENENYSTWHEDYFLVNENDGNFTKTVLVIYKPIENKTFDLHDREGLESFANASSANPWILIQVTSIDPNNPELISADLFEYQNNRWKFAKTVNSAEEFMKFMWQEYKLR